MRDKDLWEHSKVSFFDSNNRGGYLVRPRMVEFWQGRSNRLHDRIVFRRVGNEQLEDQCSDTSDCWKDGENGWFYSRLSP